VAADSIKEYRCNGSSERRCRGDDREEPGWDDKLRTDLASTIRAVLAEDFSEDELEWPYDTDVLKEPASVEILIAPADSRKIVIRGAKLARDAIASAFGPYGASVAISQLFGGTKHSKRGAQIAKDIKSANPLEEKGIDEIRTAASTVYDSTGDFSKLACILTAGDSLRFSSLPPASFQSDDVSPGLRLRQSNEPARSIFRRERSPGNPPTKPIYIRTSLRGQFMYLTVSTRLTILPVTCIGSAEPKPN
jgi:hypothetical protein